MRIAARVRPSKTPLAAATAAAFLLLTAACGGSSQHQSAAGTPGGAGGTGASAGAAVGGVGGAGSTPSAGTTSAAPPVVTITPAANTSGVDPASQIQVSVANGKIDSVTAAVGGGTAVKGALDPTSTAWTSSDPLGTDKSYTVTVTAENPDGAKSTTTAAFTTSKPSSVFRGTYTPDPGQTVGVAQPVSITFDKPITDKAAVEKALTVESSPSQPGSWHWFGNQRVDYRPQQFWQPGTKVTLHMHLDGVKSGSAYGNQTRDVTFNVAAHAITATADVATHQMVVKKDGQVVKTIPISAGKPGFDTWNGTMVVLRKVDDITMDSKTVGIFGTNGYVVPDVRYAVQLTTSGTYVHAAPWNDGKFGKVNGSHGCIGVSLDDGQWFYNNFDIGDPVTVVNSKDQVPASNGFGDWNMAWPDWTAGSAVK